MKTRLEQSTGSPSRRMRAEAASWVVRLHGPDRNAEIEAGVKRWLAEHPDHGRALELATEVWQETADLPGELPRLETLVDEDLQRSRNFVPTFARAAAFALTLCCAVLGYIYLVGANSLTTDVGEQRTVTLEDGTRVELNTSSRMRVKYDAVVRRIILDSGEAWFDVAKQAGRPFIVVVGRREVVALGTQFLVRRQGEEMSVTLLEGHVAVTPADEARRAARPLPGEPVVLEPGQRLELGHDGAVSIDMPEPAKATAWRRGQLIFEDTPLSEAAAEFNRYSHREIKLTSQDMADIRVGGTFRIGDVASFARAVANAQGLQVIDRGSQLLLARDGPQVSKQPQEVIEHP